MIFKPIGKAFIIELTRDVKTKSGLEYNGGRPETGTIIAVGNEVQGVKPGDFVMFRKFMLSTEPTDYEGKQVFFGEDYEKTIVAVIDKETALEADITQMLNEMQGTKYTREGFKADLKSLFYKHYYNHDEK